MKKLLYLLLILCCHLFSLEKSKQELDTLYSSLDPTSISQLFAYYHLYGETPQGEKALESAWHLMNLHRPSQEKLRGHLSLPLLDIDAMISFVNKQPYDAPVKLTTKQLSLIEKISDHLANRQLKGSSVWKTKQLIKLPTEEIDLARALLIYEFEGDKESIRQYEASIDLMALQILARLPKDATNKEKVAVINQFIFHEMKFRFPPHSLWAKDIDVYTFLPSVLDKRQGVCLGVSILYLCIAQRLDLPLEIITPPGHIYVRYNDNGEHINIETTARGISPPSEMYLGINTHSLQQRTMKQVIGLAFINQASVTFQKQEYATAVELYEKALPYLPDDPLLKMLLGYTYLFTKQTKKGDALMYEIKDLTFDHAVSKETIPEDYLRGRVSSDGIQIIFTPIDENRKSILEKQQELEEITQKYPKFREGIFHLAITYLQLGRGHEATEILRRYHELDSTNPTVEYYLSVLGMQRYNYNEAWTHLHLTKQLTAEKAHHPEGLKSLHHELRRLCPDPYSK